MKNARNYIDYVVIGADSINQLIIENHLQDISTEPKVEFVDSYIHAEEILKSNFVGVTICEAETEGLDYRKLCKEFTNRPCIFISSREKDEERRKCLLQYKECYLTRPYYPEQFRQAVSVAKLTITKVLTK